MLIGDLIRSGQFPGVKVAGVLDDAAAKLSQLASDATAEVKSNVAQELLLGAAFVAVVALVGVALSKKGAR